MGNKTFWKGTIIGCIVGILFYLFLIDHRHFQLISLIFLIFYFALLGTLLGLIASVKKEDGKIIWIGTTIGLVWGSLNILFGILLMDDLSRGESISLLRRVFLIPFSLAYMVSEYFNLVEPQSVILFNIGSIIIGLLIGWIIWRLKCKEKHKPK